MARALVLSAGGMFGAYQAGAWRVLARNFKPDLVVGASVGSLNAWAIASECSPDELCDLWLDPASADLMHFRFPALPWRGIFDPAPVYRIVDEFGVRFRPRIPLGLTITGLPGLRRVLVHGDSLTLAHLRASCAIPFGYPPVKIDGKWYVDGGLLDAVPLWAAVQMGATSAVVINALPVMPSRLMRSAVSLVRTLAPARPRVNLPVTKIKPAQSLGRVRDAVRWNRDRIQRWIEQGERDATAALLDHQELVVRQ